MGEMDKMDKMDIKGQAEMDRDRIDKLSRTKQADKFVHSVPPRPSSPSPSLSLVHNPVRREKLLVRIFYPLLERFLPMRWANKIKLCGCIIAGEWMIPMVPPDPDLKDISIEQLHAHFSELPGDSLRPVIRWIELCRKMHPFKIDRDLLYSSLVKASLFFTDAEQTHNLDEMAQTCKAGRRYKLRTPESVSLVYHHGLTLLPESVHRYICGSDFIDAGAYDGASALVFQKYGPHCVYSFEPSMDNQAIFMRTMKKNHVPAKKYQLVGQGLSDGDGFLHYDPIAGIGTKLSEAGPQSTRVTSIDAFAAEHCLTVKLIKADVEGMGLSLLKGCLQTIRQHRPVLLLSVYHNREELFGLYELLKSLDLAYTIRFRALHYSVYELTMIAYPAELNE